MDLESKIKVLSEKIEALKDKVTTEEATKNSFILPMLSALGYDVFDPTVVVPEFTADIGKKKGEKVDFAIIKDGDPIILIEAKPHTEKLDRHKTQLERYFTVTDSKFGILTNGIEYRFYSDLEKPNVMDDAPFLIVDMLNLKDRDIKQLSKFSSLSLDIESILDMAGSKKFINSIKLLFKEETAEPSDDMVKLFASKLTEKRFTQNVLEEFRSYIKQAFSEIVNDQVNERINSIKTRLSEEATVDIINPIDKQVEDDNGIETSNEELEGFFIVKSILAESIALNRIFARDTKSYFGILLDDNNRKWICRLHFNSKSSKYIGIHIADKEETRFLIENVEDIYRFKDKILETVKRLENI
ncbi:MAG TPA: type I restriction endonuclease [Sulfurovum sp.]|nr:MAG: hypothetical protein B7Y23_03500 [Sulfurovum sp. 16-42-52]OYZ48736.1 MAG: hypothetical protein B7Y13_06765 [Sulfurovum sp. 24-42-9]OZA46780.1 MAG: hypothetical protein B7X80_00890 [Sulfurovum sp. 17-42-90]HQS72439.1 type I restriction endonuclease [Sulfurovum sp.]HQS77265.1 type I restriction endonuclease [Sulfurovum sp.]